MQTFSNGQLNSINAMKKIIIPTFLLISVLSCRDKPTNNSVGVDAETFKEFISNLPFRTLPVRFDCGLPDGPGSGNIPASDVQDYKEFIPGKHDVIFGTVGQSDKFKLVIYGQTGDDIYPHLFSYDTSGRILDSLALMLSGCGGADDQAIPYASALIRPDLTIILTDTTRLIHYPGTWKKVEATVEDDSVFVSAGDYIVDSLLISRKVIRINDAGRFIED